MFTMASDMFPRRANRLGRRDRRHGRRDWRHAHRLDCRIDTSVHRLLSSDLRDCRSAYLAALGIIIYWRPRLEPANVEEAIAQG